MKRAFLLLPLLTPLALAQVTDGSFELGTFNDKIRYGTPFTFIESAEAHSGDSYGAIVGESLYDGFPLRTVTSIGIGAFEPGATYALSFYAKGPVTNSFSEIYISIGGGGPEAPITLTTLDAPTSLTAVWMIYSYQFSVPVNWNPENIASLILSSRPITTTKGGELYSFHIDDLTLGLVSSVPEPSSYGILAGLVGLFFCGKRRRRACTSK